MIRSRDSGVPTVCRLALGFCAPCNINLPPTGSSSHNVTKITMIKELFSGALPVSGWCPSQVGLHSFRAKVEGVQSAFHLPAVIYTSAGGVYICHGGRRTPLGWGGGEGAPNRWLPQADEFKRA